MFEGQYVLIIHHDKINVQNLKSVISNENLGCCVEVENFQGCFRIDFTQGIITNMYQV